MEKAIHKYDDMVDVLKTNKYKFQQRRNTAVFIFAKIIVLQYNNNVLNGYID